MEKQSRIKNSARNMSMNFINRGITLILKFLLRTVFIHTLSVEYLGVNGLFTNVLTLLSLADLGFGLALPYSLYRPLEEKDHDKITQIMDFYSSVYKIVGVAVLGIGICLLPFLQAIVRGGEDIPHLPAIYCLFVLNSSVSYLFIYKNLLNF